ncbi:hypothetical protein N7474_006573 [Penicillium riverlandense]|uniref:uncharacterized protein n=1 Tax=Penicillium riverlandense TaxID=1903569 RepID=UPI0025483251|nr:uncharacterized protein N7474_006573 [Penicillium riverlandense]KAJ5814796.1 hypothetical protein N7474_006573 [Penicillium riverlandense]
MKYYTTLVLALASVATADWSLYCGNSCSGGTLVASGSDAQGACTSLGGTYDYCYVEAESSYSPTWWKAIFFESASCEVNSDVPGMHESSGVFNGGCTDAGSWTSYNVVVNA